MTDVVSVGRSASAATPTAVFVTARTPRSNSLNEIDSRDMRGRLLDSARKEGALVRTPLAAQSCDNNVLEEVTEKNLSSPMIPQMKEDLHLPKNRCISTLSFRIGEIKFQKSDSDVKAKQVYCVILRDGFEVLQTPTRAREDAFFGQEYLFSVEESDFLCAFHHDITLEVRTRGKLTRSMSASSEKSARAGGEVITLARAHYNSNQLLCSSGMDQWHSLYAPPSSCAHLAVNLTNNNSVVTIQLQALTNAVSALLSPLGRTIRPHSIRIEVVSENDAVLLTSSSYLATDCVQLDESNTAQLNTSHSGVAALRIRLFASTQGSPEQVAAAGQLSLSPVRLPGRRRVSVLLVSAQASVVAEARCSVTYREDVVYGSSVYYSLRDWLSSPTSCVTLSRLMSDWQHVAALHDFLLSEDTLIPTIAQLAAAELSNLGDAATLFRGTTLVSKLTEHALRQLAGEYLVFVLRPAVETILAHPDISDLHAADDSILATLTSAQRLVESVLQLIANSALVCPTIVVNLLKAIRDETESRFPSHGLTAVASFVFLRLLAAALLNPHLFGLLPQPVADVAAAGRLKMVAKCLMHLAVIASRSTVSSVAPSFAKEEHMRPLLQKLTTVENVATLAGFLDLVSTPLTQLLRRDEDISLQEGMLVCDKKLRYVRLSTKSFRVSPKRVSATPEVSAPLDSLLLAEEIADTAAQCSSPLIGGGASCQVVCGEERLVLRFDYRWQMSCWLGALSRVVSLSPRKRSRYHPVKWSQAARSFACCGDSSLESPGCTITTPLRESSAPSLSVGDVAVRLHTLAVDLLHSPKLTAQSDGELREVAKTLEDSILTAAAS